MKETKAGKLSSNAARPPLRVPRFSIESIVLASRNGETEHDVDDGDRFQSTKFRDAARSS